MTSQIFKSNESKASLQALSGVKKVAQKAALRHRMLVVFFFMTASVSLHAQQPSMQALIDQSLSKLQQSAEEMQQGGQSSGMAILNCVAEMKRIDAMFPDSIQPKYQMALQSLYYSVMNPHAPQTENLLAETEQTIDKMEQMKNAGQIPGQSSPAHCLSDICTLRGFLYMVRIVQNPAQNGQRYYIDVMQNYEKALKLNPDNELAKQLQQKFFEGMKQQTKGNS